MCSPKFCIAFALIALLEEVSSCLLPPIPKWFQKELLFDCLVVESDWVVELFETEVVLCNKFCCCFCCISIDGLSAPTGTFRKWSSGIFTCNQWNCYNIHSSIQIRDIQCALKIVNLFIINYLCDTFRAYWVTTQFASVCPWEKAKLDFHTLKAYPRTF